jgi:O-antigen/teichoic acid export membrane protein
MPKLIFSWGRHSRAVSQLLKRKSFHNFSWMMIGQGLGYFFQAAYFVLLTRLLGTKEYGVYAGAFAFTSLFAPYASVSMGTIFLKYASGEPDLIAPYWGNILMVNLSLGAVLVPALVIIGRYTLSAEAAHLVFLASIASCVFAQLVTECARVFQAAEKMRITALLNLMTNGVRVFTVLALFFFLHHATAWQWAVASVGVSGMSAAAAVGVVLYMFGMPQFRPKLAIQRSSEGMGFAFATSSSTLYNDLDKTMLSHYGMNEANGIFTTAYRVIDFATLPTIALREVMVTGLFRAARESFHSAAKLGNRLLRRSFLVSCVVALMLVATAPLLPKVTGRGFGETVAAVRWLALIPVLRSIHQMTGLVLLATGHQRIRTANQLVTAGFNVALNLWLIPRYGWIGAAWSSLATDSLLALANWTLVLGLGRRYKQAPTPKPIA